MDENKNLKVYRASAGSGKTFTLVSEYIAMAISAGAATSGFAGILAITFTKKATGEMKMRILNALWSISENAARSSDYVSKISEILGGRLSEEEIRMRCGVTLKLILNNYDFFDVKTIDSFFQGIVGDIAAMIGFGSNLEVFLNSEEAVSTAVDRIVSEAAHGNNKVLTALLNDYIDKNLEDSGSWDFRRALKGFGENVCREIYMQNAQEINNVFGNSKTYAQIYGELAAEKAKVEELMAHLADGLTVDYSKISYGGYVKSYIEKACAGGWNGITKTMEKILAGDYGKLRTSLAEMEMWRDQLQSFEDEREKLYCCYNSVTLTLNDLNEMRMLEAIDGEVKHISRDENRILLSKSQELVSEQLRDGESVSFVFERAGRRYRHIMLDEAQDTSQMQYDNLWKLISNVYASQGNRCVVVGDVKQSIYRWRGGNWNILHNLGKRFDPDGLNILKANYRSCGKIVAFNNDLFKKISELQGFNDIYFDVCQEVKAKGADIGCIRIDKLSSQDKELRTSRLEKLFQNIAEAHAAGVEYREMAILTRKNSHITEITSYAESIGAPFRISTREAYCLAGALSVRLIIATMKYIWGEVSGNPDNVSALFVAREYQRAVQGPDFQAPVFGAEGEASPGEYIRASLPQGLAENVDGLAALPIPEMAMQIADLLKLHQFADESQYLLTFFDYTVSYSQRNAYDLRQFFDDWDAEGPDQYIASDTEDGIQAMTIHKSKGLEFHTVFIPYCDWPFLYNNHVKIWCRPQGGVYDKIPLVPIGFSKKAACSIYEDDYHNEEYGVKVDNLNLLYVALTRAKANLFLQYSDETTKTVGTVGSIRISDWLDQALSAMDLAKYSGDIVPGENSGNQGGSVFTPQGETQQLTIKMED